MADSLNFDDITPAEAPVRINGKDYVLREASGDAVCRWRNEQARAAKLTDGKLSGFSNVADGDPFLVSLCLWEITDGGRRKPVAPATVRAWPSRVLAALFKKVKEISGLEDEEQDSVRKALLAALARDDSPVSPTAFRDWAAALEGDEYAPLVKLVGESDSGRAAKN